jgi:hypothetical protein
MKFLIIRTILADDLFDAQRAGGVFVHLAAGDVQQPTSPLAGLRRETLLLARLKAVKKFPAPLCALISGSLFLH